jgi:hypothetical protein
MLVGTRLLQQQEGVLMHYSELQSRSAEVEAMASNFQKMVADEVAKAGLRAKPGPKKKGGTKGTTGRGKSKHSEWKPQGNSATKSLNPMAPPRSRKTKKIIYQRPWSCKLQAASAIKFVIAHSKSCLSAISHLPLGRSWFGSLPSNG